jgi:hypothetical protein
MKLKSDARYAQHSIQRIRSTHTIHDNAPEPTQESGGKSLKTIMLTPRLLKPTRRGRIELEFENTRRHIRMEANSPKPLWDYSTYTCKSCDQLLLLAKPEGRPGAEVMTGRRKISPLSTCTLIGTWAVHHAMPNKYSRRPRRSVEQAVLLIKSMKKFARTTVKPITEMDIETSRSRHSRDGQRYPKQWNRTRSSC